jgi:hypothetical protein
VSLSTSNNTRAAVSFIYKKESIGFILILPGQSNNPLDGCWFQRLPDLDIGFCSVLWPPSVRPIRPRMSIHWLSSTLYTIHAHQQNGTILRIVHTQCV